MHALTDRPTSSFTAVLADVSGLSLSNFFAEPGYPHSRSYTSMGFNHLPENACADKVDPTGPLHPRTYLLLFYRADALAALHAAGVAAAASPPDDWDAMLALLQAHAEQVASAGTGAASSLPAHGLCLTVDPNCGRLGDVLAAIAASVLQSGGTQQGYVFDLTPAPTATVALVNSTGWRYAADVLRRMLVYNAPDGSNSSSSSEADASSCWGVHPAFLAGQCLMTLEWDAALPSMAVPGLRRAGALGVAPLPGSRTVVDRAAGAADGGGGGALVPCSAELCAVSTNHDLLYLRAVNSTASGYTTTAGGEDGSGNAVSYSASSAAMEVDAITNLGMAAAASAVNRAPYSAAYDAIVSVNLLGNGLGGRAIADIAFMQQAALAQIGSFRDARQNFTDGLRTVLGFSARLTGDAQNCSGYLGTRWWEALAASGDQGPDVRPLAAAAGLADTAAAAAYLRALWHAIHHPNAAPDVASPVMVNWFKYALGHAAALLLPEAANSTDNGPGAAAAAAAAPIEAAAELLGRLFDHASEALGQATVRETYVASIAAPAWVPPVAHSGGHARLGTGGVIAVTASSLACAAVMAAMVRVVRLRRRRRRRHRDLLGRVVAPRVSPDTTLLITDVQNSTVLWEQLPVNVMDATLKLHHGTIRRELAKYDGYESATEGDSFIVAFADPASAVAFAAACQVSLLLEDWPPQLLAHPDAAVTLVAPEDLGEGRAAACLGLPLQGLRVALRQASRWGLSPEAGHQSSTFVPYAPLYRQLLEAMTSMDSDTNPSDPAGDLSPPPSSLAFQPAAAASRLGPLSPVPRQLKVANCSVDLAGSRPGSATGLASLLGLTGAARTAPQLVFRRKADGESPSGCGSLAPRSGVSLRISISRRAVTGAGVRLAEDGVGVGCVPDPVLDADGGGGLAAAMERCETVELPVCNARSLSVLGVGSNDVELPQVLRRAAASAHGLPRRAPWASTRHMETTASLPATADSAAGNEASEAGASDVCGAGLEASGAGADGADVASQGEAAAVALGAQPRRWAEALAAAFPVYGSANLAFVGSTPGVAWSEGQACLTASLPGGRVGLVAYRGLRVRMGMHTGLDDPRHVAFNKVGSAFKYYGPFAETAKLVSDAAPGGLVTLSDRAFARLRNSMQRGTSAASKAAREAVVVYAGRHVLAEGGQAPRQQSALKAAREAVAATAADIVSSPLQDGRRNSGTLSSSPDLIFGGYLDAGAREGGGRDLKAEVAIKVAAAKAEPTSATFAGATSLGWQRGIPDQPSESVYVAVPSALVCRLALSPPLRSLRVCELGSLAAPIGCLTVAFMKVVGASTLLADLPGPASRALDQFARLACGLLGAGGGYLVEGGDGLLLAAFGEAAGAVEWALDCVAGLKGLVWEEELLAHELCAEELAVDAALGSRTSSVGGTSVQDTLERRQSALQGGLRIKVGLAQGHASHMLTEASGRLSYRGRVMNRAARIAGIAAAGQVLCSGAVWEACGQAPGFGQRVRGASLGHLRLKGISRPVEVVQCYLI